MRQSLNGERKSNSWVNLVDFTLDELKNHLESKFLNGMTWENYGQVWHIDHIKPLSSFKIISDNCPEFRACWSLSNLQPLFALDNILKSNKIILGGSLMGKPIYVGCKAYQPQLQIPHWLFFDLGSNPSCPTSYYRRVVQPNRALVYETKDEGLIPSVPASYGTKRHFLKRKFTAIINVPPFLG